MQAPERLIDLPQLSLLEQLMGLCEDEGVQWQLLGDLLHMHINRLFSRQQRQQEGLLYQFFLLQLKARRAIAFSPQQFSA